MSVMQNLTSRNIQYTDYGRKQTILAAGAGASTKILLKDPIRTDSGKEINLVRCENVKNIMEYIDRVDEMIERKGEWLWR